MTSQNLPVFSDYQRLKRTNPNAYWSSRTQQEMAQAYQQHGMSFFDSHKEKT